MSLKLFGAVCVAMSILTATGADELRLVGTTDKASALYAPGERMTFSLRLEKDSVPVAGKKVVWHRTGDDKQEKKGAGISDGQPLQIVTVCERPGFVRITAEAFDETTGEPLKDKRGKSIRFDGGACVQPEKLESAPEPADFDAYWTSQKARLSQTPMKVLEMKPVGDTLPDVLTYDVKIACPGGMPVSGFFSKHKTVAPKSAAIQVFFQGYGVLSAGAHGRSDLAARDPATPVIALCINVHGIENGREPAYYEHLKETTLKDYAFHADENVRRETAFFNGMTLRLLRALEFMKAQPEWDGKTLRVSGGSQGGMQALLAAGLDPAVTLCVADKPWCCDLAGSSLHRLSGWHPAYTEALSYFDPVYHAKRIRCETILTAGLGDYTCPPSGISIVYNHIHAPRTLTYVQGVAHFFGDQSKAPKHTLSGK